MASMSILLAIAAICLLLYKLFRQDMKYFKREGIPHDEPTLLFGHMGPCIFRKISIMDLLSKFYHRHVSARYFGFYDFLTPVVVLRDPELIQSIAVKNFDCFTDHRPMIDSDVDPFVSGNLFFLRGIKWREMRKLLSPSFTASKMRMMYTLMLNCSMSFNDFVAEDAKEGKVMEWSQVCSRYVTDVIASCAFGINVDSMRNPNNEFYILAKEATDFESSLSLKVFLGRSFPLLSKMLNMKLLNDRIIAFFRDIVTNSIKTRKEKGITRPDMIQLMMESEGRALTIEEMTSQALVFFLAGFNTTLTMISFLTYELAVNPDVQAKLLQEIEIVHRKTSGRPTYEAIHEMRYLEAVINETMRLYPLLTNLDRVCVKEFELPPATPEGRPVTLKPGAPIFFASAAIQRDPRYFKNPEKFEPERFLTGDYHQAAYMPFGVGPRTCIGVRFGTMMIRTLVFFLVWHCEIEPCERTPIPMEFSKKSFVMSPKDGFWLRFNTRKRGNVGERVENGKIANGMSEK